jgi:hypothetical protein
MLLCTLAAVISGALDDSDRLKEGRSERNLSRHLSCPKVDHRSASSKELLLSTNPTKSPNNSESGGSSHPAHQQR